MSDIGVFTRRRIISPAESYFAAPAAAVGGGWTPADLGSALRLWIKADTGTSTTGALIDSIADQSGNGFNMSSLTTHRPTLNATGYNSLPSIDFSASNDTYLVSGSGTASSAFSMGSASSWFFIGQMDTGTDSYGRAMAYLGNTAFTGGGGNDFGSTDSVCAILRNASTNAVCMYQAALTTGASGSVSLNTNMRVLMVFDGVNATLRVNTTSTYSDTAVGGPAAVSFTLGSTGLIMLGGDLAGASGTLTFPTSCWDGTIAEAIVTNTALDATARANLDAYAVARLGV